MSLETFESLVIAEVERWAAENFPNTTVVFENGPVPEEDKIGSPWIDVSLRPYAGNPLALATKQGRDTGVFSFAVFTREGEGTAQAKEIVSSLRQHFAGFRAGSGWLSYPDPYLPTTVKGWHKRGLMFPFTVDS